VNPFVTFLVLLPLVVALILGAGTIFGLIRYGPRWDIITALIIFVIISGALGVLLARTSKTSLIEFPGAEEIDVAGKRRVTVFVLLVLYISLFLFFWLIFNVELVRNWLGAICIMLALSMIYSGVLQLRQAHSLAPERSKELVAAEIRQHELFLSTYKKTTRWLVVSSAITGLSVPVLFSILDGDRYISMLDLVGLILLLASIVIWFILRGVSVQKKFGILLHQQEEKK
jgi:hypothetical protein